MEKPRKNLVGEFLKDIEHYSDRWCILCGKPFRVSSKLDPEKERYNICPDCWTYNQR